MMNATSCYTNFVNTPLSSVTLCVKDVHCSFICDDVGVTKLFVLHVRLPEAFDLTGALEKVGRKCLRVLLLLQ